MWVGWCVSSWRHWFWPVHSIYFIHTTHYNRILTNWNTILQRDIRTKYWYGYAGVLDDLKLSGFGCAFSCMVQYYLCHRMDIGTCDIVHWSAALHHCIAYRTGFWVSVVLVLNVIRCSCHYFLDRILFHHDFRLGKVSYRFVVPSSTFEFRISNQLLIRHWKTTRSEYVLNKW